MQRRATVAEGGIQASPVVEVARGGDHGAGRGIDGGVTTSMIAAAVVAAVRWTEHRMIVEVGRRGRVGEGWMVAPIRDWRLGRGW